MATTSFPYVDMLKQLEWVMTGVSGARCPVCNARERYGEHETDCRLRGLIDKAERKKTPREQLEYADARILALESQRRKIYRDSITAPDAEKVCADAIASLLCDEPFGGDLRYPIDVSGISMHAATLWRETKSAGRLVAVRPCTDNPDNKTYLGIALGDVALEATARYNAETAVLGFLCTMHNPAMWVPALSRIVFGCGSWWSIIKTAEQLRQITDDDIDSIWYVQALKALEGG